MYLPSGKVCERARKIIAQASWQTAFNSGIIQRSSFDNISRMAIINAGSIDDVDVVVLFSNGLNGWSKQMFCLLKKIRKFSNLLVN